MVLANDIWALGFGNVNGTLIEHWNGTAWSVVPSPNVVGPLYGVATVSVNDVWAMGFSGVRTLIEHWDGTSWSVVSSPNVGAGSNQLVRSAAVSANDVWAVGFYY